MLAENPIDKCGSDSRKEKNIFLESLDSLTTEDVAPGASARRKKKFGVADMLRTLLLVICAVVFVVCMFELIDIFMSYKRAGDLYGEIADGFNSAGGSSGNPIMAALMAGDAPSAPLRTLSEQKNTSGNPGGSSGSVTTGKSIEFQRKLVYLEQLRSQNPDTYGYIVIEGTSISYPVVQTKDNNYYLKHGFNGSKLNSGTIFVDYHNSSKVEDNRNLVIYGHNMLNGSMFHDIARYDLNFPDKYGARYDGSSYGQSFFDEHRFIKLITFDGIYTFEIFSFYETTENDRYFTTEFYSDYSYMSFCKTAIEKSQYDTGTEMGVLDVMLTLSTCVNLNPSGRYACHAKLVKIEN
ncbi:MAG: class B sortase [Eubacteriales bacterium]|nr:class B sortase [Eubacteriales bacterium]